MVCVPFGVARGDGGSRLGAAHHRALIKAKRAVLPHWLDDDTRSRIEPASVSRTAGRGKAVLNEPLLGADLGERVEPSTEVASRVAKTECIEPRRHQRRKPPVAVNRIDKVERSQRAKGAQALKLCQIGPKRDDTSGKT